MTDESHESQPRKISPLQSAAKIFKKLDDLGVKQVIVGYSGGKDSLTVLDLSVRHFGAENVRTFFLYTLPNLECESSLIGLAKKRYGVDTIQLPSPEIYGLIREGYARPFSPTMQISMSRPYKWNDVEKIVRYKTGFRWLMYGHRQQDSLHRRGMLNRCQGLWETAYSSDKLIQRAYPLWQWSHKDVFTYLKTHKLPIPHMFDAGVINTSGLSLLDAETLLYVQNHYPNDYKRLKAVFPALDVPIQRMEVLNRTLAVKDEMDGEEDFKSPTALQRTSESFEVGLARILKLRQTRGNDAVDLVGLFGKYEIGIELKVLSKASEGQSRVQMRPEAIARKRAWEKNEDNDELKLRSTPGVQRKIYIVLIDNRDRYSGGKYAESYSGHRIYLGTAIKTYRLNGMIKIRDCQDLADHIFGKDHGLSDLNSQFQSLLDRLTRKD